MTYNQYQKIISYFKSNKIRKIFLVVISKILPYINAFIYICVIIGLLYTKDNRIYKVILIPMFVFVFVTIFRNILNRKRPYDELQFVPFFENTTRGKGKSFPSRHSASAFIIAFSIMYINMYVGVAVLIIAFFIGVSRVIIGVHYPSDVIGALCISLFLGIIGFYLI